MKITFEAVRIAAHDRFNCAHCGKRRERVREFEQTLNPFNRNEKGEPKSREEILAEVREEAKVWLARNSKVCKTCEAAERKRDEAEYEEDDED